MTSQLLKIGISAETFPKWQYIQVDSKATIPADKLAIISKFFNLSMEEMFNYKIPELSFSDLGEVSKKIETKTYEKSSLKDAHAST